MHRFICTTMLHIDGSYGEGGGQILRTAVAMSMIHRTEITIENIRANRPKPGMSPQHHMAMSAAAEICGADVEGLKPGSTRSVFNPGEIKGGEYTFDIGTAGSVTLMLQALIPAGLHADKDTIFTLKGGTDVKWSPPYDYFENVFLEHLRKMGVDVTSRLIKRGHYPKGGGEVKVTVKPGMPENPEVGDNVDNIEGKVFVSNLPDHIAKRMKKAALKGLIDYCVSISTEIGDSPSPGTGITLWTTGGKRLGCGVLGERGVPAEDVGKECAVMLLKDIDAEVDLDPWCADQLIPYLTMVGGSGELSVRKATEHLRTNIWLVNQFEDCINLKEGENVVIEY